LPHKFQCRKYQLGIWRALTSGIKRALWVCHRRAGKDLTVWNWLVCELISRKQTAYYILPTYSQAKKIIWEGMTKDGNRFLDFIPKELIEKKSESDLSIRFINGSLLQLVGSDGYDRLVGTNPSICIFSEMALQNPIAWDYMRPILAENAGRAIFISTPRGHNHFWDLYQVAKNNPTWFCEVLTVDDTKAITKQDIEDERASGMSEEMIEQEFYCSFETGQLGSYYGKLIKECYADDRITTLPVDAKYLVYTAWDIGMSDMTAIVFFQIIGKEIRVIDFYENQGYALDHYITLLRQKSYQYGTHYFPHDGKKREMGTGLSLVDVANQSEFNFMVIPNRTGLIEGIENTRGIFPRVWIDKTRCAYLLKCLQQYHAEYDDRAKIFKNSPKHDWASHAADAFRMMALSLQFINQDGFLEEQKELDRLERIYRNIY